MEWLTSERVVGSHSSFSLLSSKIGGNSQPSLDVSSIPIASVCEGRVSHVRSSFISSSLKASAGVL